jgi:hypothetical protein
VQVNGRLYYLDPDNFPNKELLFKLAPQLAAADAVAQADEHREQQAQEKQKER